MEFRIRLAGDDDKAVLRLQDSLLGLDDLDLIRETLDSPQLELSRISGAISSNYDYRYTITVSEQFARKCWLFKDTSVVHIDVPENYLNAFVEKQVYSRKNDETGEILCAGMKYVINENAVLNDLIENNFFINKVDFIDEDED